MRAVRYHEHGGPEVLTVEETPRPDPGADELLVRVDAASVNPVDTYFRDGSYQLESLPWIPGSDVAGVVEAVGDEVDGFEPGDRVLATGLGRSAPGTCAEYVAVPETLAGHLPADVEVDAAAALGLVGVTAWQAFVYHAELEPSQRALIHGAGGGVGHIAVQLADAAGARVTATASPAHHDPLAELGADVTLDYRRDDLADAIRAAGRPDVILDPLADMYFELDGDVAAHDGTIVAIGNESPTAPVPMTMGKFKDLTFQTMSMFNTPDTGATLERLADLVAAGKIEPVIERRYALEGVADAHRAVLGESFLGKLVVEP